MGRGFAQCNQYHKMPQILASFPPVFSSCQAEIITALQSRHLKLKSLCRWDITLQTSDVQQGVPP